MIEAKGFEAGLVRVSIPVETTTEDTINAFNNGDYVDNMMAVFNDYFNIPEDAAVSLDLNTKEESDTEWPDDEEDYFLEISISLQESDGHTDEDFDTIKDNIDSDMIGDFCDDLNNCLVEQDLGTLKFADRFYFFQKSFSSFDL